MSREKKTQIINKLQEAFAKSSISILTDYRGLSAPEIADLRRKLRGLGIEYRVVKNTLTRFAAKRTGKDKLNSLIEGPIAIAFSHGDITEPAKVLADYIRTSKTSLTIKGGILNERLLTPEDVMTLSTLPSREILLAKIVGGMQIPTLTLVNCLTTPVRGFIGVLQARIQQLEEG